MNIEKNMSSPTVLPEYFVDAEEAAKFLKMKKRTLMQKARDGSVPAHPLFDGVRNSWRFLLSELADWLRARVNSDRHPCRSQGERIQ